MTFTLKYQPLNQVTEEIRLIKILPPYPTTQIIQDRFGSKILISYHASYLTFHSKVTRPKSQAHKSIGTSQTTRRYLQKTLCGDIHGVTMKPYPTLGATPFKLVTS
jgi:hypothetical protein